MQSAWTVFDSARARADSAAPETAALVAYILQQKPSLARNVRTQGQESLALASGSFLELLAFLRACLDASSQPGLPGASLEQLLGEAGFPTHHKVPCSDARLNGLLVLGLGRFLAYAGLACLPQQASQSSCWLSRLAEQAAVAPLLCISSLHVLGK